MQKLIIASGNPGKLREMKAILGDYYDEILSMQEAGVAVDVVEDGETFLENARKKAVEISLLVDADVVSDDSGLSVMGLGGRPGVYSARYSAAGTDEANNEKLICEVTPLSEEERAASYICAIVLARKGEVIFEGEGTCDGKIILEPRGVGGFGYDSYFYLEEYGITFAEMDPDKKNKISHRARALQKLEAFVEQERK